jgi:hypothetical protein
MKNKDLNSYVEEQVNEFANMDEKEQLAKQAEYVGKLVEILPDPENEKEFNEFVELLKNPPISGNTDEERTMSFLELGKTNPKFFAQCIALTSLSMNLSTIEEIARENAPKKASVQSISKEELDAIHNEDKQAELERVKDMLSRIPVDK